MSVLNIVWLGDQVQLSLNHGYGTKLFRKYELDIPFSASRVGKTFLLLQHLSFSSVNLW